MGSVVLLMSNVDPLMDANKQCTETREPVPDPLSAVHCCLAK